MRDGPRKRPKYKPYAGPSGGYGSLKSVGEVLLREEVPVSGAETLMHQNKPDGFMCVSCAWGKPAKPHPFEYCENGAKATAWETTKRRVDPDFFRKHALGALEGWLDYDLEEAGRLTHPLRWDPSTDKYVPVSWESAFEEIGRELRALRADPDQVVFYTSGRASLETSYMFQLLARLYGTNNLPDSSNMCHESTSVALPESIGVSVGTVSLQDFEQTDLMLYLAHNPATSAPRILHQLQEAVQRGAKIISFNPLRERGLAVPSSSAGSLGSALMIICLSLVPRLWPVVLRLAGRWVPPFEAVQLPMFWRWFAPELIGLPVIGPRLRDRRLITERLIERAHAVGVQVHVWTVDEPQDMMTLLHEGADAIVTNRADLAMDVLAEEAARA